MRIAIIDGLGAGLGQTIIRRIKKEVGNNIYIIGLGTNLAATSNMIKSGADKGIIGEKEICMFCSQEKIDCLIGPIGIVCSGGIKGEITPAISQAIFGLDCIKYIIPLRKHGIYIPGTRNLEIKEIIDEIILDISKKVEDTI